jgi:oxygen-independent coproporphyrinogen-3 oxidase
MVYSLYFHIPFCVHRCAYCDFNTYAGKTALIPSYVNALKREVEMVASSAPERLPAHTIFFGGGTPSLLSSDQFEPILQTTLAHFDFSAADSAGQTEVSLEANPGTVTPESLQELRKLGFNRISLGVQSSHAEELRQLERIHDFFDVIDSIRWARQAGFRNINLDLIYGLPEQPLSRWKESVRRAVDLLPEHLSLYALTIEPATPFGHWAARGLLPIPDSDLAADMYEWSSDFLARQGYEQYEISNWAKPGCQCQHNLQYWRNQPYLGFGAGAHGSANNLRISNVLHIKTFIERMEIHGTGPESPFPVSPATISKTRVTLRDEMQETMMVGLRLTQEGVSAESFQARFGRQMEEVFGKEIGELSGLGLLEWSITPHFHTIRLTRRGRLLGNQVFMRFVGE